MSANCEDKDIEEPHRCHALLLLHISTTALLTPDRQGTGLAARLGDTPRIIVALSWGLPTPALLARQLYPLSPLCARRLRCMQRAVPCTRERCLDGHQLAHNTRNLPSHSLHSLYTRHRFRTQGGHTEAGHPATSRSPRAAPSVHPAAAPEGAML